ncbi:MAG: hypothetical protein LBN93_01450, partial [Candidatus Symbiothrix sp.]|nr:hypothetical protein [Candidatus Symbiothrix sp.]
MKNNNFRRVRMGLRMRLRVGARNAMTSSLVRICSAMTSSSARITFGMTLFAIICLLVTGNCSLVTAQVSIGSATDSVTTGSVLDLSQGYGGLLLPQVTDTTVATRTAGMMVFSQADNTVYTYNDVTSTWTALGSSGGGASCNGAGTGTITGLSGNT